MSQDPPQPAVIEMRDAQITAMRNTSLVVLEHVNWTVAPGEFWIVAGPQHAGKTDLLLHAAGLISPARGTCRLFGGDATAIDEHRIADRQRVGFVFSDGRLFNQLTLAENIALPLRYHKSIPEVEAEETVGTLLEACELKPCAALTPPNVATGWRQRAALARALALKPDLLLLDNPNGGLIARHRYWLLNFLDRLWRGHNFMGGRPITIVAATDDLRLWQNPERKFATVHEGNFHVLGNWGGPDFSKNIAVKELLASTGDTEKL